MSKILPSLQQRLVFCEEKDIYDYRFKKGKTYSTANYTIQSYYSYLALSI